MFSSGISDWRVSQGLGLLSISSVPEIKKWKKWQLVSSEREILLRRHFSDSPWECLIRAAAMTTLIHHTVRLLTRHGVSSRPYTKKKAETILEDSGLNPLSSFPVQRVWPHISTLSKSANGVTIKLKRQQWKCTETLVQQKKKTNKSLFSFSSWLNQTTMHTKVGAAPGLIKLELKSYKTSEGTIFCQPTHEKQRGEIFGAHLLWHHNRKEWLNLTIKRHFITTIGLITAIIHQALFLTRVRNLWKCENRCWIH